MIISLILGLIVIAVLAAFFYRTLGMDIAGAIFSALLASALLAILVTAVIYAAELFR